MPSSKKISRVTIRIDGEVKVALDYAIKHTLSSTPSDIVRRAILVYAGLVKKELASKRANPLL